MPLTEESVEVTLHTGRKAKVSRIAVVCDAKDCDASMFIYDFGPKTALRLIQSIDWYFDGYLLMEHTVMCPAHLVRQVAS